MQGEMQGEIDVSVGEKGSVKGVGEGRGADSNK